MRSLLSISSIESSFDAYLNHDFTEIVHDFWIFVETHLLNVLEELVDFLFLVGVILFKWHDSPLIKVVSESLFVPREAWLNIIKNELEILGDVLVLWDFLNNIDEVGELRIGEAFFYFNTLL